METLKLWRNQKGYSLEAAGALIGVSGVQWYRYETGERKVSFRKAPIVEQVTGISRHDLRPDIYGPSPKRQRKEAREVRL